MIKELPRSLKTGAEGMRMWKATAKQKKMGMKVSMNLPIEFPTLQTCREVSMNLQIEFPTLQTCRKVSINLPIEFPTLKTWRKEFLPKF